MSTKKIKVGIVGTGNIGTDLLLKIQRSKYLECAMFAGIRADSLGILRAQQLGIPTSTDSIRVFEKNRGVVDIVFDATSAAAHRKHAPILKKLGIFAIDLTPSRIGKMCVPLINADECLTVGNVNMITCGGQATIPIISEILKIHPECEYVEIVSSISSKSAGIGTRENIDEYTQTTAESIRSFSGMPEAKAIIILNPAEPPILMNNTIYALVKQPNLKLIKERLNRMVKKIKKFVPGYELVLGPVYEHGRVIVMMRVEGQGDFLPKYAGNLDIINAAAIEIAEQYARKKFVEEEQSLRPRRKKIIHTSHI